MSQDLLQCRFPCLFTATLPAETTARVWDALMVEGPKVLFRVGLALLKVCPALPWSVQHLLSQHRSSHSGALYVPSSPQAAERPLTARGWCR